MAILGAADFDAAQIDPNSILLDGVAPRSVHFAHLPKARIPFAADRCALEEPHEFIDLVARFDLRELFDTVVGSPAIDDLRPLILSGQLRDGTRFEGSDAIIVPNQPTIPVGTEIRK